MHDSTFIAKMMDLVDNLAGLAPSDAEQYADEPNRLMYAEMQKMYQLVSQYREWVDKGPTTTRDRHVGESDYSQNNIQPWDAWIEYAQNPWDADIQKRLWRTKQIPGLSPALARIQDYEKIKHICDERIDQINAGEPWYRNFKMPPWVESD